MIRILILSSILILSYNKHSHAQRLATPAASPKQVLKQTIGYTETVVDYSRPSLNGRRIFGKLIPLGDIWRAGANECTRITFQQAVEIGGKSLGPGTFSLFVIPGEKEWTWILNEDTSLWGTRGYTQALDIVRVQTQVEKLKGRIETMEFRWMNLQNSSADLALEWEYTRAKLPIKFMTDKEVEARIDEVLAEHPSGTDYYRAARYYLDQGKDLKQALKWMEKRVEMEGKQFGILRYKALIEYQLGQKKNANETMALSLQLAKEAGNQHYVRMNQQSLKDWNKEPVDIKALHLLQKSIQYHDPDTLWGKKAIDWRFYESRPSGGYRLSHLQFDPMQDHFTLKQQSGRDEIVREVKAGVCRSTINGNTSPSEAEAQRYRLNCERNTMYRNYYTYLWGLPMKLKDPGTIIDPKVHKRDFFGEELLELKVTYDPQVGKDIWYFYFDPETYAMKGYRFYHDEAINDGEYILLKGEVQTHGMRIPAQRTWYTHKDQRILGTDELVPQGK